MIDFDKITQFDINKLDASKITKLLVEHEKSIIYVFIVGSLIVTGMMFNDHRIKEMALQARLTQEQGKIGVIKARDAAIQDLSNFKSSIPKELNVFDVITLISNYAKTSHTSITSYTPNQNKDMGLYDVIDVSFIAVSGNFKDAMLFMRKIEKSNFPIMVDSWSAHEDENGKISFTIAISAVLIHP